LRTAGSSLLAARLPERRPARRRLGLLQVGDDWIVIALVLYATTFLAGLLFIGPESGRVGKLTEEGSPEAGPRTLRLLLSPGSTSSCCS
jgi:hypothetical protein